MFTLLLRDAKIPLAELLVKVVLPSMSTLLLSRTLTPPPEIAELLLKVMFPVISHIATVQCKDSSTIIMSQVTTKSGAPTEVHIATVLCTDSSTIKS